MKGRNLDDFKNRRLTSCLFITLLLLPLKSYAEAVTYVDLALGLSIHVLDETDEGAASEVLKTAIGVQWFPFLSTQVGVWSWSGREGDSNKDSTEDEMASFNGLSASWEIALQLPLEDKGTDFSLGPYYRFGRHCWSAVITGLVQPWSKEGCSQLQTLGFVFPSTVEDMAAMYIEFTRTDFDDLTSSSLQLGAKLAF